jgi:hypothetical protein
MDRDPSDNRRLGDTHPLNPAARLGPNGIWNEDVLPVFEWESPEHRVVLPATLEEALGLQDTPVLRWDSLKYRIVVAKHGRDLPVIKALSMQIDRWEYIGIETATGNMRVMFPADDRWYAVSIGERQGGHTVISVFGGSDKRFLANRLRGLQQILMRGK